jgi:CHAT domain-containing protein/Tfp pilus assembly protein PilF
VKILKWLIFFCILSGSSVAQDDQAWRLYYDSTQLFWAKDWNKTVNLLEHAERSAITDLGIYNENYLTILNDLGTAYWKTRDYHKAEKLLTRSLELKSEVYAKSDKEIILSLSNMAGFYAEQGMWKKSKSLYNQILSTDRSRVLADIYVTAAQSLVSLYDLNQQADSADFLLQKIEGWHVIPANTFLDFQHKFFRARIDRKLQKYDVAKSALAQLVSKLSNTQEPELKELYIQSLQEQGILYLQTGDYSQAEKNLLKAYSLVTNHSNRDHLLTELANNLAQVYDKLNISDKALAYYSESLARCRISYDENSLPCAILQNNIAGIHLKENNVEQAIKDYLKVTTLFEKLLAPSDPLYITALNNLATAYRKNSQFKQASEYLVKADKLLKKNGMENSELAATIMNNIAVINTADGEYEQAAIYYKRAYEIKRAIYGDNSIMLLDAMSNLAVTYWALGKPQDGIPLFKKSMELATRQVAYIFPTLNENEQVQFYQKLKEDFERFNTIAIQWSDYDGELVSQMFQNRTIIKSLQFFTQQRLKKLIEIKNDSSLNTLVSRVNAKRDALGHMYQLPLNDVRDGNKAVAKLEKEIDVLEKSISQKTSEALYENDLSAKEIHWKALVAKMQPNEAIVEIVRFRKYDRQTSRKKDFFGFTDSVYYAALIIKRETKETPELVIMKEGTNLETRYFNYYKNSMKYQVDDGLSYKFFWEPIQKNLSGKTRIYLASDGVYHKLNVNTLREPFSGKFLLEKYDIIYLLNPIQFLENKTPLNASKRNAVLMGDPVFDVDVDAPRERGVALNHFSGLPGTQAELRAIDKVLKGHSWKTGLFMKSAATETNLKAVHSPTILHLASHGFFSSEMVSLNAEAKKEFLFHSGIVLTGANRSLATGSTSYQNDGIVTAFEVMNIDLTNTQLVVLSACETGLGKIENGEGVFGLQRSFMQAGARNVLISLWKVDDELTKDLMIKFYQYLTLGHSLSQSLKQAQLDQARLVSDPSNWGGFILVGNN